MEKINNKLSDIYYFNSTCEMAIANGMVSYMPPRILQKFEEDLQVIPSYFASPKDIVVVNHRISSQWLEYMCSLGFTFPVFLSREELLVMAEQGHISIGEIRPWGWSPAVHNFFKAIKPYCYLGFQNSCNGSWDIKYKEMYSRCTAHKVLKDIVSGNNYSFFPNQNDIPSVCYSIEELEEQLNQRKKIVIKSPFSCSGRGVLMIKDGIIKQSDRQWMRGILRQQEYLTVENWNNNIFDFSLHYFVDAAGTLHYKGSVSFDTNEKGAYEGNNLSLFTKETDKSIREFLSDKITLLAETLKKAISNTDIVRNYRGYLGVDMYVYLEDGEYKVFPCVEINLRYNMGTLALALGSRLKHKDGKVFTLRISDRNAVEYADRMREKYPVHLSEGLLSKGFVPLIPLSEDTSFITALHLY